VVPVVIEPMFSPGQSLIVQLVALLGILFAVLVYAFLAFIWLVKPLASGLPGR
jgi:LPS O-antigen subunit length determinant protein (WzzB/FepE family)